MYNSKYRLNTEDYYINYANKLKMKWLRSEKHE